MKPNMAGVGFVIGTVIGVFINMSFSLKSEDMVKVIILSAVLGTTAGWIVDWFRHK